jgi:tetratricopeptide (TPR) repeat protein
MREIKDSVEEGIRYFMSGNYARADEHFSSALHDDPEDLLALVMEIKVCISAGLYEDGIIHCKLLLSKHAGSFIDTTCFIYLGCCYLGLNDISHAQHFFTQAKHNRELLTELYYEQAQMYRYLGQWENLLDASTKALSYEPPNYERLGFSKSLISIRPGMIARHNHTMHICKGIAHTMLQQYREAIFSYKNAIQIGFDHPSFVEKHDEAWAFMGLAFYLMGQYTQAIEMYQTALKLNPNNILTLECLRRAYFDSDQEKQSYAIQKRIKELEKQLKKEVEDNE